MEISRPRGLPNLSSPVSLPPAHRPSVLLPSSSALRLQVPFSGIIHIRHYKECRCSGGSPPLMSFSMTRARPCGARSRVIGLAALLRGTTTTLSRQLQPLELHSPSVSQVCKLFTFGRVPWYLYYDGKQGPRRGFLVTTVQMERSSPIQPPITNSTIFLVSRAPGTPLIKSLTWLRIIATSQQPWLDSATGRIVYFQTPSMADGAHKIGITVTSANATNQFFLDYITVTPSSGVKNSESVPSSTATSSGFPTVTSSGLPAVSTHSTPVSTIVGCVVGGVTGIAILVIVLWWCLWRRGSRAQPRPGGTLVDEGSYTFH